MNTRINVVCTRLVPHCGTNRGCDINRGNTVNEILHRGVKPIAQLSCGRGFSRNNFCFLKVYFKKNMSIQMTNQSIQHWQEAPLRYFRPALYHILLATPVKRLHRAS